MDSDGNSEHELLARVVSQVLQAAFLIEDDKGCAVEEIERWGIPDRGISIIILCSIRRDSAIEVI